MVDNDKKNKLKLPIIILGIILFLGLITFLVITLINKEPVAYQEKLYYITLDGESSITLYQGDIYNEPGYSAKDDNGNDVTNEVAVTNTIDTDNIGEYKINYTIGNITKERIIKVIEKPIGATYIHLYGDINTYLYVGETYIEKGYEVIDTVDSNLKDKVKIDSNVNTSKEGIYKVIYSVTNSGGVTTSKERTVIVMDRNLSLIPNITDITNKNITINIYAKDELFSYLILPNNIKITDRMTTYEVSSNGTYKFVMYNKKGESKEKEIEITNIDKENPTGSCNGYTENNNSYITVNAQDNIGISKYMINDTTYTTNNITVNSPLNNVTIIIYDKADNTVSINCNLENKNTTTTTTTKPAPSYNPPTPTTKYNIDTDTLKVWIENKGTYYISHIWVQDAYHQFKGSVTSSFGNNLERASIILKNSVKRNNLENKAAIAVNASGFILNGTFGQTFYNANHAWNRTSESPIVIYEGRVLRDFSTSKVPTSVTTYGLKSNGDLAYYEYRAGTNNQDNINTSQRIINDGVLYTAGFRPALVGNGKTLSSSTSPNIRQGFCQIDKNNFIFITNNSSNRSIGFSFKSMGNLMVSLGCQTGVNLDGGGSTTLLLKDRNNNITKLYGDSRSIADIYYFHE